jgi:hypothetical protein
MTTRGNMTGKELDELSKLQTQTGLTKDRLYRLFDQSNLKSDPPSLRNPADVTIVRVSGMPGRCRPVPENFYVVPPPWGWTGQTLKRRK